MKGKLRTYLGSSRKMPMKNQIILSLAYYSPLSSTSLSSASNQPGDLPSPQTAIPASLKNSLKKMYPSPALFLPPKNHQTKAPLSKDLCHLPLLSDISFLSRICPSNNLCSHLQHHYTLQPKPPSCSCQPPPLPSCSWQHLLMESTLPSSRRILCHLSNLHWHPKSII